VNDASTPWWHDQRTHIPTYRAVQSKIEDIVNKKYGGWSEDDRADLVALVVEKYLWKFGKESLPKNDHGEPDVPFKWLKTVVTTTAIDMHRKQEARSAEVVDFGAPAANGRPELVDALRDLATPSLISMRGVAAQQALDLLAADYPFDRDLLYWRYIRGVDLSEIAARIGKSREATKKAVQRAVARLRTAVLANDDLRMALLDRPEYPIE